MSLARDVDDSLLAFATFALSRGVEVDPLASNGYNRITELSDSDDSLDSSTDASCTDEACCPQPCPAPDRAPCSAQPQLPPEILLQILDHALTASLQEPFIVDNQFGQLTTYCRPCLFRSLCLVSSTFYSIAQEVFVAELVLDRREAGTRDDSRLVDKVRDNESWGKWVKRVDASLRGSNSGGVPERMRDQDAIVTHLEPGEKDRERQTERDRNVLLKLLEVTPQLQELDVDLGFHSGVLKPGVVPASVRKLTLRNAEAEDTFTLINSLPNLVELTVRLVLDFYLRATSALAGLPALRAFELSIVGWGETDAYTILRLLAGSRASLRHLSLRNKGAVSIPSFLPVVRELIAAFGAQLASLAVRDIPHRGLRPPAEAPLATFFPPKPPVMARLEDLHLSGLPYDPAWLTLLLGPRSSLRRLTVEDFDERSVDRLLACLALPALKRLEVLRVAHTGIWKDEKVIEAWAREREVELHASWLMRRVSRSWW